MMLKSKKSEEKKSAGLRDRFRKLAECSAQGVGTPWAFMIAATVVVVWGITGPIFHYSDTWQLVINTGTTIITFLMVFLIQNSQNRQSQIVTLKLDELLKGVEGARTDLINLDHMSEDELETIQKEFERLKDCKGAFAPLVDDDLSSVEHELNKRRNKKSDKARGKSKD